MLRRTEMGAVSVMLVLSSQPSCVRHSAQADMTCHPGLGLLRCTLAVCMALAVCFAGSGVQHVGGTGVMSAAGYSMCRDVSSV